MSWREFCRHGIGNGKDGTHAQARHKAQDHQCGWRGCEPTEQRKHRVPGCAGDEDFLAANGVRHPASGNDTDHDAKGRCNREEPHTKSPELKFLLERWKHAADDTNIV